ncbi:hypothetical protein [Nostocoides vanveenii]|uniref:Transmembrane protein n=1 Tax=Nostocoides vanveenii TaxID=330835 RepID=A0ABN2KHK3_9MICO
MNNFEFALEGAWKVLAAGLLLGAGLPAIFAFGIRALAYGQGGDAEINHEAGHPVGKVLAILCFAIVLAAVALGITTIVASGFGQKVSFEHIYPMLVDK